MRKYFPSFHREFALTNLVKKKEHTGAMRKYFPSFHLHTIDSAGHWPHHETPQQFLDVLNLWFVSHARSLT